MKRLLPNTWLNKRSYSKAAFVLLFSLFFIDLFGASKTFTGPGNFSDPTKWSGGTLPVAGDVLTIDGICTIDNYAATHNIAYGTLIIGGSIPGSVNWITSGTNGLNVTNVISFNAGSALDMTNGGTLTIRGSFTSTNIAFTPGTGTIDIQSTVTLPAAYATYNNLNVSGNGVTVSVGVGTTVNGNLTITVGSFSVGAFSLAVAGTTTVGGTFLIGSSTGAKSFKNFIINNGTYTNSANAPITISGNLQNSGSYNGGTGMITFTGATSNSISGASTTAFSGGLTVNKGTNQANVLDVQSLITMPSGVGLTITNGTFKLSSPSTIVPFVSATHSIPATAALWNNGGVINFVSGTVLDLNGLLKSTEGTMTLGAAIDDRIESKDGCSIVIAGGTVNVPARIGRGATPNFSFTMTGGILNMNTVGSTSSSLAPIHITGTSSFTMTGGTLIIHQAGGSNLGYNVRPGTYNVTGGTLQIGDATTPASSIIDLSTTIPIFNLVTYSNVTTHIANSSIAPITILNDHTIQSGASFDANTEDMFVGGNWINNGGTFIPSTGTLTFNGIAIQSISKTGGETFYKLTINSTGLIKLLNDIMITNTLSMTAGNINLNNKTLTLGNNAVATLVHGGATTTAFGGVFKRWWPTSLISSAAPPLYGLFPIGTSYDYRSIEVNSTGSPTTAGYVSASHTDAVTITNVNYTDSEGDVIQRIQNMKTTLAVAGLAGGTYNLAVKYTCLSATGSLPDMKLETYTGNVMGNVGTRGVTLGPVLAPTVKASAITAAQLSNDFVVGTINKTNTPLRQYYYSRKNGNWTDATAGNGTWSFTSGGAGASCDCTPSADGYVVISAGQTVAVNAVSTVHYVDIEPSATLNGASNLTVNFDLTTFGDGRFTPSAGAWTVSRDVYVTPTSSSAFAGSNMTISTNLILDGTLALGTSALTLNGIGKTISGTGNITGSGTVSITTGNKTFAAGTNVTINPTLAIVGAITVNNNGGTVTLAGGLTGSVAGSTWTNDDGAILNVAGALLTTGTLNATAANNTVNYNGSGAQVIKIPVSSMYNKLNLTTGGTKTAGSGTTTISNLLTIADGVIFNAGTNAVNGNGGLTMSGTSRLIVADIALDDQPLPSLTGTYTLSPATTIEFAGAGAQDARGVVFQNMDITGNNSASSVNMSSVTSILGNLNFTNMGQLNSNAALGISGNLNYGSSQRSSIVNTVTVNGTSTISGGIFDLNSENLVTNHLNITSGSLLNNGLLHVAGNITNNQPTTTLSGTLTLNGTGVQTINGTQPFKTYHLISNNSAGINLNTNLAVSGVHTFTVGVITTSAAPAYLIYEAGSSYTGSNDASHINGSVKKIGTTSFIFPVGNALYLRSISLNSLSTNSEFNVKYLGATPNSNQWLVPVKSVQPREHWSVNKLSGGTAVVGMNWDNSKVQVPGWILTEIVATSYNGSNWIDAGGSASGNVSSTGTISSNTITAFDLFTFGSRDFPLPLTLVSFTAARAGNLTKINWKTVAEYNVSHFVAERSDDNILFYPVTQVSARNSGDPENYSCNDLAPIDNIAYYRLKCVDQDGKLKYSQTVALIGEANRKQLVLLTNPVRDLVILEAKAQFSSKFDYRITAINGHVIKQGSLSIGNAGQYSIPTGNMKAGVYMIGISNSLQTFNFKFIVQ